jgi:beta-galactosidase
MSKEEVEGINAKQQMMELIKQNFNHPSIMFWGIQNEIQIGGERPEVRKLVKELNDLTKKEDPTRLSTMANVMFIGDTDEYNYITDVVGYNKYYGWYVGKAEDFSEWIDSYHKTNPKVSLCISEYGAEGIVQYHSSNPQIKDYTEEYHALYHEKVWKILKKRPFLWATYVWNMFDFGANIRDEGGVKGRNNKGLVSYDRKIKKDAFYMYKAHWSDEKFVHITSKRFVDRIEDRIQIKVYSNCDEVTLYVNGKVLESKISDDKTFIFEQVELHEGINEVKAVGIHEGEMLEDTARFNKVSKPNGSYNAPKEDKGEGEAVVNWFQMPDFSDTSVEELEITDDVYSTRCTFGEIMRNEEAAAVIKKYLPKLINHPMFAMQQGMTIDLVSTMAGEVFTEKFMYILNKELTKIKKT